MGADQGLAHVGADDAGRHRVDPDVARRQLHRQCACQCFYTAFGGGVVALALAGLLRGHRTEVDDAAAALTHHAGQHLLTAQQRADQVGLDDLGDVTQRLRGEQTVTGNTGVVDQQVDTLETLLDPFKKRLNALRILDITLHGQAVPAEPFDLRLQGSG